MAGSTRTSAPLSAAGSPDVRRSWLRSAPPSAVGGARIAPGAPRRIAARIDRIPVLPEVDEVEARPVASGHVQRAVRTELDRAHRMTRILLTPVLDEHLLGPRHHIAVRPETRQPPAHDATVVGRTGRGWTAVGGRRPRCPIAEQFRRSPRRACTGRRRTAGPGNSDRAACRADRGPRSCGRWSAGRRTPSGWCRRGRRTP